MVKPAQLKKQLINVEHIPLYFSDKQLQILDLNPEIALRGNVCPTCNDEGTFKLDGKKYECPTDDVYGHIQSRLFRLYLTANIDLQYQTLSWDDFPFPDAAETVDSYIKNFKRGRFTGLGMLLWGTKGTGKTWAANHILKELVKQGYTGWCADFRIARNIDTHGTMDQQTKLLYDQMMNAEILILDEVVKPFSEASQDFHESKLEDIIRYRTNHNFPTICTTNMTPKEFEKYYPRVFSLLSAKQYMYEFDMKDMRGEAMKRNMERHLNGETCPIT